MLAFATATELATVAVSFFGFLLWIGHKLFQLVSIGCKPDAITSSHNAKALLKSVAVPPNEPLKFQPLVKYTLANKNLAAFFVTLPAAACVVGNLAIASFKSVIICV